MLNKIRIALGLALSVSLLVAVPSFAGGWAIITLDEMPAKIAAGEPLTIGFTVLQHGRTPMNDLTPTVTATLSMKEHFVVNAEPDGKSGHYSATLTFPREGDWEWSIQAFTMDQSMPVLSVSAPPDRVTAQTAPASEPVPISPLTIIRVAALGVGLVGLVFVFRRKSRLAVAFTAICLLIGVGTFVTESAVPAVEAQSLPSPKEVVDEKSVSQVELGGQLFIAKGCITCHTNDKAAKTVRRGSLDVGAPNLTKFSASPEYLRRWLEDPASVKPGTWMPNLDLSDTEVEALIAFINSN